MTARREADAGFEVYRLPLPAVLGVKEGINLPRYPTLNGRLALEEGRGAPSRPRSASPGGLHTLALRACRSSR